MRCATCQSMRSRMSPRSRSTSIPSRLAWLPRTSNCSSPPVESALAGLPKVQQIRSVSLFGLSYVAVYFEDDMDIYFARQLVNERLQQIGDRLPEGYGKPTMGPNVSGLGQVDWYPVEPAPGVRGEGCHARALRTGPAWTRAPNLPHP